MFLTEENDLKDKLESLWKSDIIKDRVKRSPILKDMVNKFVAYPRGFCDYTNLELEISLPYPWLNVLPSKNLYMNPVLDDIALLKDVVLMTTLDYNAEMEFDEWLYKMQQADMLTQIISDSLIYHHDLELRSQASEYPIWFDRFTTLSKDLSHIAFTSLITAARLEAYTNPKDYLEERLAADFKAHIKLCSLWKYRYNLVEDMIVTFYTLCTKDKLEAVTYLKGELEGWCIDEIPFKQEAEFFLKYKNMKKEVLEDV